MRILIVANNFPRPNHAFDGIFNLRAAQALQARGHDVLVVRYIPRLPPFTPFGRAYRHLPDAYEVEGIKVRLLRGFQGPQSFGMGTLPMQLHAQLYEICEAFRPEIVHAHGLLESGLIASSAGRRFIVTAHGSESYRLPWKRPGLRSLAQRVLREADAVAAVSEFVADHVRRLGRSDIHIVHNGANSRIFAPADRYAARRALRIDTDRPTIVYAGQLIPAKGLTELANAVRMLSDLEPQVVIAGDGPARESFYTALHSSGTKAYFLGAVNQPTLAQAMAAADVFALPSYAEGLPTVICEAMNAGRAVVATTVGGIPEIVHEGETGFVVAPRDDRALAARIREILVDGALRERLEGNAAAFARERLTWDANASAYEELYCRILGEGSEEKERPRAPSHPAVSSRT